MSGKSYTVRHFSLNHKAVCQRIMSGNRSRLCSRPLLLPDGATETIVQSLEYDLQLPRCWVWWSPLVELLAKVNKEWSAAFDGPFSSAKWIPCLFIFMSWVPNCELNWLVGDFTGRNWEFPGRSEVYCAWGKSLWAEELYIRKQFQQVCLWASFAMLTIVFEIATNKGGW